MNNDLDNSYVIRSNLEYVKSSMEKINNKINNTMNTNQERHYFESNIDKNNLYDSLNNISNKYFKAEKGLMEKLQKEVEFNVAIGETYDKLDKELEKEASNL